MTEALLPDEKKDAALARSIRSAITRYGHFDEDLLANAVILLMWVEGYKIVPNWDRDATIPCGICTVLKTDHDDVMHPWEPAF